MGKNGLDNINFEAYIAGVQEAKNIVKNAIQADKDILSKIVFEYNETENVTNISFPKGVLPLRYFNSESPDNMYFVYEAESCVGDDNTVIGELVISESSVSIQIEGEWAGSDNDVLEYILFNGDTPTLNTYNLFYPQSGTKLYRHVINFVSGETNVPIEFISTRSASITLYDDLKVELAKQGFLVKGYGTSVYRVCITQNGPNIETQHTLHFYNVSSTDFTISPNTIWNNVSSFTFSDTISEL